MRSLLVLILMLPCMAAAKEPKSFADQIRFPVEKYQLKNGMTVLLHVDHSSPLISVHQWYRVGSRHEKVGRTGLAHFFEHLMFKGTEKISGKQLMKLVKGNGGYNNAFTSKDYTGYHEDMPAGTLELVLDIESDRMRNLLFKPEMIQKEREVVKEERRYRVSDSVSGSLQESVFKTVFKVHPYRWPVIGYMKDLNAATVEDLKEFYRVHYAPNNSVLVVVGSFDPKKAKKWIDEKYGKIQSQKLPVTRTVVEPQQKGARGQILRKNVQSPTVAVVFQSPQSGEREAYAMDLLSNILGEGSSSRLHKRIVYKEQRALSIGSFNYTPMEAGIFQISASVKPGANKDKVLSSIYAELYKMRTKLVGEKELDKAKNQVMKSYVDGLKTISGKARMLAINEIYFSDYQVMFEDLEKYQSITREEIKNVAEKYLVPSKRSVVQVLPKAKVSAL